MCQSVKTLLIYMDYKVDIVVELLQCFPKLENLFAEVMIFRNVHTVVLVLFKMLFLILTEIDAPISTHDLLLDTSIHRQVYV